MTFEGRASSATQQKPKSRAVSRWVVVTAAAAIMGLAVAAPPAAHSAARVSVENSDGKAEASLSGPTVVRLKGSGFQSVQGGFGGIYVMFGWVKAGSWQPSAGGTINNGDYLYVPDEESKSNAGHQRFVAFPGSNTEDAANGGTISSDGSWQTDLIIPGPTFESVGRGGGTTTVDCREVTCGILTIGAHGVVNQNNETFTPISFANISDESTAAAPEPTAAPDATTLSDDSTVQTGTEDSSLLPAESAQPNVAEQQASEPTIVINRDTAVVGRILAFTAAGFIEGEQVVVVLDDGIAAVGPLTTGRAGTLAGAIQLPESVRMGTHSLTITSAASARTATVSFPVRAAEATVPETIEETSNWPSWLPSWPILIFVGVALALFIAAIVVRLRRKKSRAKAVAKSNAAPSEAIKADPAGASQNLPEPGKTTPAQAAPKDPPAPPAYVPPARSEAPEATLSFPPVHDVTSGGPR